MRPPLLRVASLEDCLRYGGTYRDLRPLGILPRIAGAAPDAHTNFAYSTVKTAPSPANSGTSLGVQTGDGALFPAASFNAIVCPAGQTPLKTNAEIVRVTAIATDTFTITRTQEGSTARSILVGDQIFAGVTAKTLTDAESSTGLVSSTRAYLGAATTTAAGAKKLNIDTVDSGDDPGAYFDKTTNHRYNVPVAGRYLVQGVGDATSSAASQWTYAAVYKNGVLDTYGTVCSSTGSGFSMISVVSALLTCAANDYIEFFLACSTASLTVPAGKGLNQITIEQVA